MKNTGILCFLVLIVAVIGTKYAELMHEAKIKCIDNFHLNQTEITEILALPIFPEDNEDFGNFLNCVWIETGFKNSNGSVNFENIKSAHLEKYENLNFFLKTAISMHLQIMADVCENPNEDSEINVVKMANCIKKENDEFEKPLRN